MSEIEKSKTQPAPAPVATPAPIPAAAPVAASPAAVKPGVTSPTNVLNANIPTGVLGLKAIAPPLLPVTASQQSQLLDLLAKYKANQVSPEEYYKRRAEILAQP